MKACVLYWSATGNTEKVARTISSTLQEAGVKHDLMKIPAGDEVDVFSYDLVFLGCPSYSFMPPDPVVKFVKARMKTYNENGVIKPKAPAVPGKNAIIFVTYSGPHTGIDEATPVGKYLGQFFAHLGYTVRGEWYTVGEFHNNTRNSTEGRLGNIIGRPNEADLAEIRENVRRLLGSLSS